MPNDNIGIYDHNTGETIVREMTDEEQAQRNAEIEAEKIAKAKKEAEALEVKAAKLSAYQKLGLTEAEIEALLPSPKSARE